MPSSIYEINDYHDWIVLGIIIVQGTVTYIIGHNTDLGIAPFLAGWLGVLSTALSILLAHMRPMGKQG